MKASGFMIDLDGTVYKGGIPIPGAKEFISKLKNMNIPFVFLTNNSSYSREHYLNKLNGMGFDVTMKNIMSSTLATTRYIQATYPGKSVYPVGTEQFVGEVREAGIKIVNEKPDIVLLAFDRSITYEKINNAYNFLKNGAEFIATHPDDLCPTENGYDIDIGPFIRMFEQMTSRKAMIVGKPNVAMVDMAASEMNVDRERMCMIGDRLYTDMKMAFDAGIQSILVLSGETSEDDINDLKQRPTEVYESVASIALERI